MTNIGALADVINAEATILEIGAGLDEVITMFDITQGNEHPENSIVTRGGRIDFHGSPHRIVTFKAVVTKALYDVLNTASTLSTRKALPLTSCRMTGMAISTAANDIILPFNATFPTVNLLAGETGYMLVDVKMKIDNSSY